MKAVSAALFAPSFAVACTATSTGSSGTTGTTEPVETAPEATSLPKTDCESRCTSKAMTCGGIPVSNETPGGTAGYCGGVCTSGLTEAQMACAEGKSCAQLGASSIPTLCPLPVSANPKKEGDACTCTADATAAPNAYKVCIGHASACFTTKLGCRAEIATGNGVCRAYP